MNWRALLGSSSTSVIAPWLGGKHLYLGSRSWRLTALPPVQGWYVAETQARVVTRMTPADAPDPSALTLRPVEGYLIGDLLVPDTSHNQLPVKLVPAGTERFARVRAAAASENGPLIFAETLFGLGPEPEVEAAFLERRPNLDAIKGVLPGLSAAWKFACDRRVEAEAHQARVEAERLRREAQTRVETTVGRRHVAQTNFEAAARAALQVGQAEYLSHKPVHNGMEVIFRIPTLRQRFSTVCSLELSIIDAGVCLRAENDRDGFRQGTQGDRWLTLESLPSVIREADALGRLVIFRQV